ncbi:MAG TPA: hypothetical protein VF906_07600 [Candidatus Bathyarchaeia archaeon]
MRTSLVEAFQSTMNECFLRTLHDMLGSSVTGEVSRLLEKSGVPHRDIALRFDEVVEILTRAFGSSARVLIYKTVASLYEEYSLRPGFGFYDSLKDKVSLLKEKVISDLLKPRHSPSVDDSIYIATR